MANNLKELKAKLQCIENMKVIQISKEQNYKANNLAKLTVNPKINAGNDVMVDNLTIPSIEEIAQAMKIDLGSCSMDPFIAYLTKRGLPDDEKKNRGD